MFSLSVSVASSGVVKSGIWDLSAIVTALFVVRNGKRKKREEN